ncbi:hypothetical protein E2562_022606 [Oryza meyeriana var. granulata]|uniref:Uncharacterized protein n=1 Tax=Oryza meyeriana var. granulata TaxID=110450 RepID=A0A6G1CSA1_9ORYZ|nr:hypothetical protein E2562_022606 [Oryza meyeriana var. granulata]
MDGAGGEEDGGGNARLWDRSGFQNLAVEDDAPVKPGAIGARADWLRSRKTTMVATELRNERGLEGELGWVLGMLQPGPRCRPREYKRGARWADPTYCGGLGRGRGNGPSGSRPD